MLPSLIVKQRWTPAKLNTALWIEARRADKCWQTITGTTAVTDTSVCGTVQDLSGNGFDLTAAANDTTRPTWNFNGGLPYLNFDGSNDVIFRSADLGLYNSNGHSLFMAVRANPATSAQIFAEGQTPDATPFYSIRADNVTASTLGVGIRNDANSTLLTFGSLATNFWNNTDQVVGVTDSFGTVSAYLNGVPVGTPASYTPSGTLTINRTALGALIRNTTSSWFATRVYALVAVKRVISATERKLLVGYLGKLAGLTI